jgi:hypothetical protein
MKRKSLKNRDLYDIAYQTPKGSSFIYFDDAEKLLGKRKYKKFVKYMADKKGNIVRGEKCAYPYNLSDFIESIAEVTEEDYEASKKFDATGALK